jgi:hypothetical protein
VHPHGVFANYGKEPLARFFVIDCPCFERFNESEHCGQRRAQLMRNIGEKFLAHLLEPLKARDVNENPQSSFSLRRSALGFAIRIR